MTAPALWPAADHAAQWFAGRWPGALWSSIRGLVWHTTEGDGWPDYDGGAIAPHFTAYPDVTARRVRWRQHFPLTMSCRALENRPGGVQTNTTRLAQVELVGTCDPTYRNGGKGVFWPAAPDWALEGVAELPAFLHEAWSVPLSTPARWLPYPQSYGANGVRIAPARWAAVTGSIGHQHVPENVHGDPGALPIARILELAQNGDDMPLNDADKAWIKSTIEAVVKAAPAATATAVHNVQLGRSGKTLAQTLLETAGDADAARAQTATTASDLQNIKDTVWGVQQAVEKLTPRPQAPGA